MEVEAHRAGEALAPGQALDLEALDLGEPGARREGDCDAFGVVLTSDGRALRGDWRDAGKRRLRRGEHDPAKTSRLAEIVGSNAAGEARRGVQSNAREVEGWIPSHIRRERQSESP